MKKKSMRGSNHEGIKKFLTEAGPKTGTEIQKATGIKSNIYTTLASMVRKGLVFKKGKIYSARHTPITIKSSGSPVRETKPNPVLQMLWREIGHIQSGIDQLTITKNYLQLRAREIEKQDAAQ